MVCILLQMVFIVTSTHIYHSYTTRYLMDNHDTIVKISPFNLWHRLKGIGAGILLLVGYVLKMFEGKIELPIC